MCTGLREAQSQHLSAGSKGQAAAAEAEAGMKMEGREGVSGVGGPETVAITCPRACF